MPVLTVVQHGLVHAPGWTPRPEFVADASGWLHAVHPLRIVFTRHVAAKRRRTEARLVQAAAGGVVVRVRGARQEHRWRGAGARSVREAPCLR